MSAFSPGLVTVFGGSGFIGAQAVRALARDGWRVRVALRNPNLAPELRPQGEVGQIQLTRCDVASDADVAQALKGADAAVYLVGVLHEAGKRTFKALHVEAAARVARAAANQGVRRLVHISAIGADAGSPSAYARSKAEGEAAVRAAFPDAVILRPSVVFGAGDGFLNRFADLAVKAPALPLIGGGETRFQPVYVGDVAQAIARAAGRADARGRTYELGGPAVWSMKDVLTYVVRETGRERPLAPLPFFAARALGGLTQIAAAVGMTPPLTQDQVILLESDNVVTEGAHGLSDLGVEATGMEAIAPSYLWRYRKGGQFAEAPAGEFLPA